MRPKMWIIYVAWIQHGTRGCELSTSLKLPMPAVVDVKYSYQFVKYNQVFCAVNSILYGCIYFYFF